MQPDIIETEITRATERVIASALEECRRLLADPGQDDFTRHQQLLLIGLMPPAFRFVARREEQGADPSEIANEISCALASIIDSLGMNLLQNERIGGPTLLSMVAYRLRQARTGEAPPRAAHEASYKVPGRA